MNTTEFNLWKRGVDPTKETKKKLCEIGSKSGKCDFAEAKGKCNVEKIRYYS